MSTAEEDSFSSFAYWSFEYAPQLAPQISKNPSENGSISQKNSYICPHAESAEIINTKFTESVSISEEPTIPPQYENPFMCPHALPGEMVIPKIRPKTPTPKPIPQPKLATVPPTTKIIPNRCKICGEATNQCCKTCSKVFYCSKDHQRQDWKLHKPNCYPSQIIIAESGRRLVATRDVRKGELIISETPIFLTPNTRSKNGITCLGCCKGLTPETTSSCVNCGWPMCSQKCDMRDCHEKNECDIFINQDIKPPSTTGENGQDAFQILCQIGVLRMLLFKATDPISWVRLMMLESFKEQRKSKPDAMFDMSKIVKFIREDCQMSEFGEDVIDQSYGILRGNSFDTSECTGFIHCFPENARNASLIFLSAMIPGPSCIPNGYYSITGRTNGNYKIVCTASVDISKNEPISIPYENQFSGTFIRQDVKQSVFFMSCKCYLCLDPTELGTYLSSPKCGRCKDGYFISTNPLMRSASWKCFHCHRTMDHLQMLELLQNAKIKLQSCMNDGSLSGSLKTLCDVKTSLLHPNHFLVLQTELEICRRILTLFGAVEEVKDLKGNVSTIMANLVDVSRHLLGVADVLCPGNSRMRGRLLYCLQFGLLMKLLHDTASQEENAKQNDSDDVKLYKKNTLNEITAVQAQAEMILAQETDDESEEFNMLKTIRGELKMVLKTIH